MGLKARRNKNVPFPAPCVRLGGLLRRLQDMYGGSGWDIFRPAPTPFRKTWKFEQKHKFGNSGVAQNVELSARNG